MSRACKTLHTIEYTDADGSRKTVAAGQVVEAGVIPKSELDVLVGLKAVRLFDPLDRDLNGNPGGSLKGGRRRKAVAPVEVVPEPVPEPAPAPTPEPIDEGLFD